MDDYNFYIVVTTVINKIGMLLTFSLEPQGIRAWNFRMMIRKILLFLRYQNRNNFESNPIGSEQVSLSIWWSFVKQ